MGNSIDIDPLATLFKLTHGRNDTPFEAQFSGFFQAKAGMAGEPDGARQADLAEIDTVEG